MSDEKGNGRLPGGIQSLMKNVQGREESPENETQHIQDPEKRSAGRPKVHKKGLERTSITLDPEVMGKLRSLALNTGRQLNAIIEEALLDYFKGYEKKNGEIVIPEIYRKNE